MCTHRHSDWTYLYFQFLFLWAEPKLPIIVPLQQEVGEVETCPLHNPLLELTVAGYTLLQTARQLLWEGQKEGTCT